MPGINTNNNTLIETLAQELLEKPKPKSKGPTPAIEVTKDIFSRNCLEGCHPGTKGSIKQVIDSESFLHLENIFLPEPSEAVKSLKAECKAIARREDININFSSYFKRKEPSSLEQKSIKTVREEENKAEVLEVLESQLQEYKDLENSMNNSNASLEEIANVAKQSELIIHAFEHVKFKAQGDNEKAKSEINKIILTIKSEAVPQDNLQNTLIYALEGLIDDSYDENRIKQSRAELDELQIKQSIKSIKAPEVNTAVNAKLIAHRALANLTNDPTPLLEYFPVLEQRIKSGKISKEEILEQINTLAMNIKGGYIGKGGNMAGERIYDTESLNKSPYDTSSKFMIAAAWLTTKPDKEYSPDDIQEHFPVEINSINGSFLIPNRNSMPSSLQNTLGLNLPLHTVVQNFKSIDDINTIIHEFIHQRDRLRHTDMLDGHLPFENQITGLRNYHQEFANDLNNDAKLLRSIFGVNTTKELINPSADELAARAHTAFLSGNEEFHKYASELQLPGYELSYDDALVKYYGVDPLRD